MKDYSKYIGLPFKDNGRTLDGCDCYGLVRLILKDIFSVYVTSFASSYDTTKDVDHTRKLIDDHKSEWTLIEPGEEQEGDVILITIQRQFPHMGIVVTFGTMLHIGSTHDSILTNYNTSIWKNRIDGFYRYN